MPETNPSKVRKFTRETMFYVLYLLILFGIAGGIVSAVLLSDRRFFGILACILPFGLLMGLSFLFRFFNKLFYSRPGGIFLLVFLIVMLCLAPTISVFLFLAALVCVGWFILKIIAPDGTYDVTRIDSQGRSTTETKIYYGDRSTAMAREKRELEKKGYDRVQIDE